MSSDFGRPKIASVFRLGFRRRSPISNSGAAANAAGVDPFGSTVVVGAPASVRVGYASADALAPFLCLVTPTTTSTAVVAANRSPTIHLGAKGRDLRAVEGA
jgi:hypothetical protein